MKSKIIGIIAAGVIMFSSAFAQQGVNGQDSQKGASQQGGEGMQQGASEQGGAGKQENQKDQKGAQGSAQQGGAANDPATIQQVQQALETKGYGPGPVDGKMGKKTQEALKKFQKEQGMQPTGKIDQQTLSALGIEGPGGAGATGGKSESEKPGAGATGGASGSSSDPASPGGSGSGGGSSSSGSNGGGSAGSSGMGSSGDSGGSKKSY